MLEQFLKDRQPGDRIRIIDSNGNVVMTGIQTIYVDEPDFTTPDPDPTAFEESIRRPGWLQGVQEDHPPAPWRLAPTPRPPARAPTRPPRLAPRPWCGRNFKRR
jgi:hypothetical protein